MDSFSHEVSRGLSAAYFSAITLGWCLRWLRSFSCTKTRAQSDQNFAVAWSKAEHTSHSISTSVSISIGASVSRGLAVSSDQTGFLVCVPGGVGSRCVHTLLQTDRRSSTAPGSHTPEPSSLLEPLQGFFFLNKSKRMDFFV